MQTKKCHVFQPAKSTIRSTVTLYAEYLVEGRMLLGHPLLYTWTLVLVVHVQVTVQPQLTSNCHLQLSWISTVGDCKKSMKPYVYEIFWIDSNWVLPVKGEKGRLSTLWTDINAKSGPMQPTTSFFFWEWKAHLISANSAPCSHGLSVGQTCYELFAATTPMLTQTQ